MRPFSRAQTIRFFERLERRVSSSGLALVTSDDRVLVVKANYKSYWSFPGGIIDPKETPAQAAIRETEEETGISVSQSDITFRMVVDRVSTIAQTYQFIFEAPIHAGVVDQISIDTHEIEDWATVSRSDILAGDRTYSESVQQWAKGNFGYHEQRFGAKAKQEDI